MIGRIPAKHHIVSLTRELERRACVFASHEAHIPTEKLFKNLLYGWLILHTALLVPHAKEIWGPDAFVIRSDFIRSSAFHWILRLSLHPELADYYMVFVFGQIGILVLGILGVCPSLVGILAYLLTANLNELSSVILDGGNNLAEIMTFYLVFVNTSGRPTRSRSSLGRFRIAFSNAAFTACRLQLAIVYLTAGLSKANGQLWQSGMALYYILQVDAYSHPFVADVVARFPVLSLVSSYATMGFQISFPFLVWSRRARIVLIVVGALMHAGIAIGMGLFTFGVEMVLMLTLFFDPRWSKAILDSVDSSQIRLVVVAPPRVIVKIREVLKYLDWRRCVVVEGCPTTMRKEDDCLFVYREDTVAGVGSRSLLTIALKIPLMWVALPMLMVVLYPLYLVGLVDHVIRVGLGLTDLGGRRTQDHGGDDRADG